MKQLNIKLTKEMLNKARDEVNLILFNLKGFGIKEMQLVNNIIEGLKDVKIKVYTN